MAGILTQAQAAYVVQLGAFAQAENADRMVGHLQASGFPAMHQTRLLGNGQAISEVVVGPFDSHSAAVSVHAELQGNGQDGFVRHDSGQDFGKGISEPRSVGKKPVPLVVAQNSNSGEEVLIFHEEPPKSKGDSQEMIFHEESPKGKKDSQEMIFHEESPKSKQDSQEFIFQEDKKTVSGQAAQVEMQEEDYKGVNLSVNLQAEAGALVDSGSAADSNHYLHADVKATWSLTPEWEFQLGARADGYYQHGGLEHDSTRADYGESFIRYRGDNVRVTAGSQTILWGKIDEAPPTDRLSVQDLTRFIIGELPDRRRATPALRLEAFKNAYKLDVVWVPDFREAELPDINSVWSPIDKTGGRLRGAPDNAVLSQFISQGTFGTDITGSAGGLRVSHSGEGLDYALTLQRFRHSAPAYELNPTVRASYLAGNPIATAIASTTAATFAEKHPQSWLYGGDIAMTTDKATWRFELAYMSDVPATTTDFRLITLEGVDWMGGVEFYPGGGDTRVNLQLGGRHLLDAPAILDRNDVYNFNGEIERVFAKSRWRGKGRFSLGLDDSDIYLNPELAYLGAEPHEFYVSLHYFDGNSGTFGGFHQNDSLLTFGWRASY